MDFMKLKNLCLLLSKYTIASMTLYTYIRKFNIKPINIKMKTSLDNLPTKKTVNKPKNITLVNTVMNSSVLLLLSNSVFEKKRNSI